jgi:hypothetical protein
VSELFRELTNLDERGGSGIPIYQHCFSGNNATVSIDNRSGTLRTTEING